MTAEILRRSKLPATEAKLALSRLAAVGLVRLVRGGETDGGYVPGPQLLRLTPAARERLQDQLILAAAPDHPLASAIRDRRRALSGRVRQLQKGQPR
jgi:DNA-binding IclR family transcriptional regulator